MARAQDPLIRTPDELSWRDLDEILRRGESESVEFKSSFRWDYRLEHVNHEVMIRAAETAAAFLNTRGGTLIIGVDDDGNVLGIENDYRTLRRGHQDRDGFEVTLRSVLADLLGGEYAKHYTVRFVQYGGKDVCLLSVAESEKPVYITHRGEREFHIRDGNATRKLDVEEAVNYVRTHWPE